MEQPSLSLALIVTQGLNSRICAWILFCSCFFEVCSLYVAETSLLSCGNSPASAFQMLGFLVRPITRGFKISLPFND